MKSIVNSIELKLKVVRIDPYEKNLRSILNWGHTVGHAVELKNNFLHGEAVAIGMIAEAEIGMYLGITSEASYFRLKKLLSGLNFSHFLLSLYLSC